MGDAGAPEIGDKDKIRWEVLALESRIDRSIDQLSKIGNEAFTKRLMFYNKTDANGHAAIRFFSPDTETPNSDGIINRFNITTNIFDPDDKVAKSVGLSRLSYGISFTRNEFEEGELGSVLPDERGGVYGTFYLDKSGRIVKLINVPKDDLRKSDLIIDEAPDHARIIDVDAMKKENLSNIIEVIGGSIMNVESECPNAVGSLEALEAA